MSNKLFELIKELEDEKDKLLDELTRNTYQDDVEFTHEYKQIRMLRRIIAKLKMMLE
jgi:ribosomal protein L29